ncbi:MAG: class I SAM-dependent rRNA methyltransferase [Lachnospiraceae bacterium]|jgi:23S rRNA (cytosine1962-C5)-methyltransferase|nr:class I SAM-dependent rRNA methyltransferase [Lachnospiraceae bacterium]MEE3461636.1 class I SAM-dependent rRNA methyltransferase [Lachnospiraceae bacterium]
MSSCTAILKKNAGRTFKAGGPWIYDNEVDSVTGDPENGSIVDIADFDGYKLGKGFINTNSKIRIRILTRNTEDKIDHDFIMKRVRTAWEYRKKSVDTSSCRVIFGEADFLPGITIDKFSDVLVVESLALGIDKLKSDIIGCLKQVMEEDGIIIRGVYERSDAKVRRSEGMELYKGFIGPEFDTKVPIVENGVKYIVDVENGQKTGFFLDQKYNRLAMQRFCKDADVLDLFTHTGSFALNAGIAGAKSVLGVDASELAIAQAEENACLNGLSESVRFQVADIFDLLPELDASDKRFDVVILDPPALTKSRNSVKNAEKGYREINRRSLKLVKNEGYFATCSCSHFMTADLFKKVVHEAADSAHKKLRQVEFRTQAPDHPVIWGAEGSFYLKFIIFQVFDDIRK